MTIRGVHLAGKESVNRELNRGSSVHHLLCDCAPAESDSALLLCFWFMHS